MVSDSFIVDHTRGPVLNRGYYFYKVKVNEGWSGPVGLYGNWIVKVPVEDEPLNMKS